MPPKRKRGGARGRPAKQEKDMAESLDTSKEDIQGGELEDDGEAHDDSLIDESVSELEMSADLDKNKDQPKETKNEETLESQDITGSVIKGEEDSKAEGEDKKFDSKEEIHLEISKQELKRTEIEDGNRMKEVNKNAASAGKQTTTEKTENSDSKTEGDQEAKAKTEKLTEEKGKMSKDKEPEKKAARTGLLETPERHHMENTESRSVKVVPIAPFEVKEMRSHWKWSIRISPVKPEDIMASDLMTMPRVQDAYYHVSKCQDGNGQMELCMRNTNDTILAMLRILRSPFVNRTLTVEVVKRTFIKMEKKAKESDKDGSSNTANVIETKPVQESVDGSTGAERTVDSDAGGENEGKKEEAETEEDKGKEEMMEDEDEEGEHAGDKSGLGTEDTSIVWGEARETAAFVVFLNRIQRINLRALRKLKDTRS